jgi:hypothetical protein
MHEGFRIQGQWICGHGSQPVFAITGLIDAPLSERHQEANQSTALTLHVYILHINYIRLQLGLLQQWPSLTMYLDRALNNAYRPSI